MQPAQKNNNNRAARARVNNGRKPSKYAAEAQCSAQTCHECHSSSPYGCIETRYCFWQQYKTQEALLCLHQERRGRMWSRTKIRHRSVWQRMVESPPQGTVQVNTTIHANSHCIAIGVSFTPIYSLAMVSIASCQLVCVYTSKTFYHIYNSLYFSVV